MGHYILILPLQISDAANRIAPILADSRIGASSVSPGRRCRGPIWRRIISRCARINLAHRDPLLATGARNQTLRRFEGILLRHPQTAHYGGAVSIIGLDHRMADGASWPPGGPGSFRHAQRRTAILQILPAAPAATEPYAGDACWPDHHGVLGARNAIRYTMADHVCPATRRRHPQPTKAGHGPVTAAIAYNAWQP